MKTFYIIDYRNGLAEAKFNNYQTAYDYVLAAQNRFELEVRCSSIMSDYDIEQFDLDLTSLIYY